MLRRSESTTAQARAPSRSAIAKIVRSALPLPGTPWYGVTILWTGPSGCETRIVCGRAELGRRPPPAACRPASRRRSSRSPPGARGSAWRARPRPRARRGRSCGRCCSSGCRRRVGRPERAHALADRGSRGTLAHAHPRQRPPASAARTAADQPAGPGAGARSTRRGAPASRARAVPSGRGITIGRVAARSRGRSFGGVAEAEDVAPDDRPASRIARSGPALVGGTGQVVEAPAARDREAAAAGGATRGGRRSRGRARPGPRPRTARRTRGAGPAPPASARAR